MAIATTRITVTIETVGPKEAEAMLGRNPRNRKLSDHRVSNLARDMAEGRWRLNGETVKFNGDGTLLDGQHRLAAVIRSGVTVPFVVVRGLETEDQETIDHGATRTVGNALELRGEQDASLIAAAALLAWKIDQNDSPVQGGGIPYPSATEIIQYLDEHVELRLSKPVGRVSNASVVRSPPSSAVALHYLMARKSGDLSDRFWASIADGTNLTNGHPAKTLRDQLIRDLSAPRRMNRTNMLALTIKAWNFLRAGKTIRLLKWSSLEQFPQIT